MVDMVIDLIDISKKSEMKIKELQMVNPTNIKKEETEAFEDFYWDNDDLLSPTKEEDSISEKTTNLPAKAKTPDILNTSKRSIPETTTSQSAGYQCTTCGRILKNLSGLKQHELSHQNIQPYWCDYCPVKCKTKGCLLV